jgi:hypothetical protein
MVRPRCRLPPLLVWLVPAVDGWRAGAGVREVSECCCCSSIGSIRWLAWSCYAGVRNVTQAFKAWATRDAGKNLDAKRFRHSDADCDARRIRPTRHYLTARVGHSKLDESMIVRPRLPYRPVAYFSIDYVRYTVRTVACNACPQQTIWSTSRGPRDAQVSSRRPGVPPISRAIAEMHSSSRGAARVISQSRGH